jgi:hypothetical protein
LLVIGQYAVIDVRRPAVAVILGQAIHERFRLLGGVDLPDVPREAIRQPVDLGE